MALQTAAFSLVQYTCLSLARAGRAKEGNLTGDPSLPASGGDPGVVSLETARQVRK